MKQILALLFVAVIAATACTKKKNQVNYTITGDYLIIGRAGGFTSGAPTTYYLINNGELRSDNTVSPGMPPTDIKDFKFNTLLSDASYQRVKHLPSLVPAELLAHNGHHIGDVLVDAGYTDVCTTVRGVAYRWYIEGDLSKSSDAIRQFADSLQIVFR
jgi:hypothetical protein